MATHSSVLACRIPGTGEPAVLPSLGSHRVGHDWSDLAAAAAAACLVMSDSGTPWTVTRQAPLSMWFSRQEYWSGLPFPDPGNIPYTRIKLGTPALQEYSLLSELLGKPMNWISALIKEPRALPCPMWYVGTAKIQPSTNQEECFHQKSIQS